MNVLVIGGGQAGLAAGYHLRNAGLTFLIVDAAARVGDSWRQRYASLTLFTPRQYSALPGLALGGNREQYPTRDEFADYLETYASTFSLPLRLGTRVVRLTRTGQCEFAALLDNGATIEASRVIIATGGFQVPLIPPISKGFGMAVKQLTADTYNAPSRVASGPVLVVGDGASGRDIAAELASFHPTMLATGKPRKLFPERILGKSVWWWLDLLGLLRAAPDSLIGRKMRKADAFPDRDRGIASLERLGVRMTPRLTEASGSVAIFQDGSTAEVSTVIWSVGYRDNSSWVQIPGATQGGAFLHVEGRSPVPGLYFVGRSWQRNRASALVMGVGRDAEIIVSQIMGQYEHAIAADGQAWRRA
ncbi:Uncharacterized oxidoreductase CzcO-like [Mesorhizobium delmotii]|uniref:Uncharacterized oxidoreductase CzcO-like n=2 Tax=Mesorhizobium delmotii TaxID=1631247 RepID=A0A2P9AR99_9HYPH|nr:Uncharacterized oxidoreductase CzcO-like [Mesorhizobium delmotii]